MTIPIATEDSKDRKHNSDPDLVDFIDLINFLIKLVECNICFQTPTARNIIRQCENGHIVCNSCYNYYNELRSRDLISETEDSRHQPICPSCRTTQTGYRSLIAENIITKLSEIAGSIESSNSQN